ncbi:MAG: hypothetical protein HYR63_20440 [Proteobacteria bacterium]|nr:hypothetical protein [Pseudomonadota bacterium]MBI3498997.1 hypothetical protein [Pseudomonadota bacterium]
MRAGPLLSLASALLLSSLLLWPASVAAEPGFVEGVEDLPLMDGLAALPDAGLSFDAPEGRIVVAYAKGQVSPETVIAFYASTLPQLGWQRLSERSFQREKERLSLEITRDSQGLTVRFTLAPKSR